MAQRIARCREEGHDVVVVVSAMGHTTDELTGLAAAINPDPPRREMDMLLSSGEQVSIALLAMALNALGVSAVSMTGPQVGIVTESTHSRARILEIRTDRVQGRLAEGAVVVVAGFQGTSSGSGGIAEITTLGRGGSDTSAVALAAALGADACEIYTDVPGVLTTDPRKVTDAQLMTEISCDEMLELASLGASVLHPRAVEIARNYGVPLVVRSSWSDAPGTRLTSRSRRPIGRDGLELGSPVDGVEQLDQQAVLGLSRIPDEPGIAARLFETLSGADINVDLIIQSTHEGSGNDITFTVAEQIWSEPRTSAPVCCRASEISAEGDDKAEHQRRGDDGSPWHRRRSVHVFVAAGHQPGLIATSEVKVSCVIDATNGRKALQAVERPSNCRMRRCNSIHPSATQANRRCVESPSIAIRCN